MGTNELKLLPATYGRCVLSTVPGEMNVLPFLDERSSERDMNDADEGLLPIHTDPNRLYKITSTAC